MIAPRTHSFIRKASERVSLQKLKMQEWTAVPRLGEEYIDFLIKLLSSRNPDSEKVGILCK